MNNNFESIFKDVKYRNIVYCIEASSITVGIFSSLKHHILGILYSQAAGISNYSRFNVICFNSEVAKWCTSLVPYTNDHIGVCKDWLRHIQPAGSCNFLAAAVSALRDRDVNALCFVVAQEPDHDVDEILDLMAYIGRKIQIHVRLCLRELDVVDTMKKACDAYSLIAAETGGSFSFVKVNEANEVILFHDKKHSLSAMDTILVSNEIDDECQNETNGVRLIHRCLSTDDIYPMCAYSCESNGYKPFDYWKRISACNKYVDGIKNIRNANISQIQNSASSHLAGSVILGRKVLARKYPDGQYYEGVVKEQVENDLFQVMIEPFSIPDDEFSIKDYQFTRLIDLIDYDDAIKRSILPGDRVLAPDPFHYSNDLKSLRYVTGTVLDGAVVREYCVRGNIASDLRSFDSSSDLIVEFTNPLNRTARIPSDKVIYISEPFYQRLFIESSMPQEAREHLYQVPNYPEKSLPGYPTSGPKKVPLDFQHTQLNLLKGCTLQIDCLTPPFCLPVYPVVDIIKNDDNIKGCITTDWTDGYGVSNKTRTDKANTLVPHSTYTVNELEKKVQNQLKLFDSLPRMLDRSESYSEYNAQQGASNELKSSKRESKRKFKKNSSNRNSAVKFSDNQSRNSNKQLSFTNENASLKKNSQAVHEEYQMEIDKIRRNMKSISDSISSTSQHKTAFSERQKSDKFTPKTHLNENNNNCSKVSGSVSFDPIKAGTFIAEIGQKDREREMEENDKLKRRQRQVQRRLKSECEKFCYEERKKDEAAEYRRRLENERLYRESLRRESEKDKIDKTQSMKRTVLIELENKVNEVPPCEIKPQTFDEIDRIRIDRLKRRREERQNIQKQRDDEAQLHSQKVEENHRNRCNSRWWNAQNQFLKELAMTK